MNRMRWLTLALGLTLAGCEVSPPTPRREALARLEVRRAEAELGQARRRAARLRALAAKGALVAEAAEEAEHAARLKEIELQKARLLAGD